jgi:uncharacterized protein YndB with AHSA1/START domain
MSYELRIERIFDAPPELVFDTLVDPDAQPELFAAGVEGWELWESDRTGEPDRMTYVFTDIDRPRRLSYDASMYVSEWKRTIDFAETFTFEEQDGKTLLTIVQSGFESEEDRDAFMDGTPGFLDSLQRVVAARVTGAGA